MQELNWIFVPFVFILRTRQAYHWAFIRKNYVIAKFVLFEIFLLFSAVSQAKQKLNSTGTEK